MIIAVGLHTSL